MKPHIDLSIVVPIFNEEGVLGHFCEELVGVLGSLDLAYEVILVDDGSMDGSWSIVKRRCRDSSVFRGIRLTRNFGQQIAITAGLQRSKGSAVICMDADLQHPPSLIPDMVDAWKRGALVVNTFREDEEKMPLVKRWGTRMFYSLINKWSDTPISVSSPDFRLMDRRVVDRFLGFGERDRFVRGLVNWLGFKTETLSFSARPQPTKESRYTFGKMAHLAADALTSFTAVPLRLAFYMGITISFLTALYAMYVLFVKLVADTAIKGWASLIMVSLFLGGCQMIFLGILGEYLHRIYNEVKRRPLYITDEELNIDG